MNIDENVICAGTAILDFYRERILLVAGGRPWIGLDARIAGTVPGLRDAVA